MRFEQIYALVFPDHRTSRSFGLQLTVIDLRSTCDMSWECESQCLLVKEHQSVQTQIFALPVTLQLVFGLADLGWAFGDPFSSSPITENSMPL